MRRFSIFVLLAVALGMTALAPSPSPAPSPTAIAPPAAAVPAGSPAVAPAIPAGQNATVLVYPFDVQTGVSPKIGVAIAEILAQEMAAAGGLNVLPVPQGVARAAFLQNAREQKADFYISGYVTPVGDAAAVVEQVVGVDSGVILFSQTAQVQSVADVASQSLLARAQILAFVNRGTQSIGAQSANTPAPTATNGANMKLKGLSAMVDSVFHRGKGTQTPTPDPAQKPARGVIVAPVTAVGAVSAGDAAKATNELYFALNHHYNSQMTTSTNVATAADAICGTDRNNTIAAGTLTQNPSQRGSHLTFTLAVYTCFGAVLDREVGTGTSFKAAVDAAVAAYAAAHPENS